MDRVENLFEAGKNDAIVTFICPILWLALRESTEKAVCFELKCEDQGAREYRVLERVLLR